MMTAGAWLAAVIVVVGLLAAPAALPTALDHGKGDFHLVEWAPAWSCMLVASLCWFIAMSLTALRSVPIACRFAAVVALAVAGPLAVTSSLHSTRADVAFLAMVLAVTAGASRSEVVRWAGGLSLTAAACALEATAVLWPLGLLWSALSHRQMRGYAWAMLAAAGAGVAAASCAGWPALTGCPIHEATYAIHRDVTVLLPLILLGLAGYTQDRGRPPRASGDVVSLAGPGWAAASVLALLLAVLGIPLNVRIAVLGLCWQVPRGLTELVAMVRAAPETGRAPADHRCDAKVLGCVPSDGTARPRLVQCIGWLSGLLLMLLSWPAIRDWGSGVLLGVYLLLEGS